MRRLDASAPATLAAVVPRLYAACSQNGGLAAAASAFALVKVDRNEPLPLRLEEEVQAMLRMTEATRRAG